MKTMISLSPEKKRENVMLQRCVYHVLLQIKCDVIVIVKSTLKHMFLKNKYVEVSLSCSDIFVGLLTINKVYLYLHHTKVVATVFYLIYDTDNTLTLQQMALLMRLHINVTCEFARLPQFLTKSCVHIYFLCLWYFNFIVAAGVKHC